MKVKSLFSIVACVCVISFPWVTQLTATASTSEPAFTVRLWDSGSDSPDSSELGHRENWRAVPSDLLRLEVNPAKASSDPGYYGREYVFHGNPIIENSQVMAVLVKTSGKVVLYSKTALSGQSGISSGSASSPVKILEVSVAGPISNETATATVERNAADNVVLNVVFSETSQKSLGIEVDRSQAVYFRPSTALGTIRVRAPIDYTILPSFIGDDLLYGRQESGLVGSRLALPAENFLVGLLAGESSEFVMTWPSGKQEISAELGLEQANQRAIESLVFNPDGKSFCLAPLDSPGIWHKETLGLTFLEKEVAAGWKRPFVARWKTLLYEEKVKTTYAFREDKGEIWRGVSGSYDYPVWFEGDQAFYHLSKKVPPKGDSVIYFLEGQGTPSGVTSPVEILKTTLGRQEAEQILDAAGRKLRTHHRRGGDGVHRACTCGCTEAIQAVFESHEEMKRKDEIKADLADMVYFVHAHVNRINDYRQFAEHLIGELEARKIAEPGLADFAAQLRQTAEQIPRECAVQSENMKSFAYADELVKRTMTLTEKEEPNNLKAYLDLLKEWRAMGGAQDYVLAQCHVITRKLAQEAGYGCADKPEAVSLAKEVRGKAREILRNPDGYEIWADY